MKVLVTGAAGFIGFHTASRLLSRGDRVVGLDCLNDYYDVNLKKARLAQLQKHENFEFLQLDLADRENFPQRIKEAGAITSAIHLAAQAGVRHSIEHPFDYVDANLIGHMSVLELCRHQPNFEHLVYASSSSVYGGNTKLPFAVEDRVDAPVSLYAATKLANEHMSYSYAHLYGMPQTGLRFFTVYGPWGRPDMALYIFADAIMKDRPIKVFNNGDMKRDFTFVEDIVTGVVAAHDNPPTADSGLPHRVYNIGNNQSEPLMRMISVLEDCLGKKAETIMTPMQMGDVKESFADIEAIRRDLGFEPTTSIDVGVPKFVDWFKEYNGIA